MRLFYARRVLRLFPAFFLLVVFLVVVERIGWIRLNPGDLAAAFTYTVNFRTHSSWYIGHLWSLSVEEQFYLLWPMLLAIGGRRRAAKVACAVLLVSPLARIVATMLGLPGAISPCVADSLASGCLLAICGDALQRWPWYTRLCASKYFLPACTVVICACNWGRRFMIGSAFGVSIINVLLALVVHRCVALPSKTAEFWSGSVSSAIPFICGNSFSSTSIPPGQFAVSPSTSFLLSLPPRYRTAAWSDRSTICAENCDESRLRCALVHSQ